MGEVVLSVKNLSKAYQLGQFTTGTLSRDIERWWALKRGKEDPFLKIGQENDRTQKADNDIVWSLKDVNFEVEQGDALGVIGRNGAGKSTLLKVLSKVTSPTTGSIRVRGRIASLLEVGTGFHPELTGRENIFLNGAILGMRKWEIAKKFDEIVDFAGVARYVDTPVKRYSSGMYVRLAFAVAAHLEPEILVVDEVLAVGDAEFQKKALGKMKDVGKNEGRTVLFVSHNMAAIRTLCNKGILLKNGKLFKQGKVDDVVSSYLTGDFERADHKVFNPPLKNGEVEINEIKVKGKNNAEDTPIAMGQSIEISLNVTLHANPEKYHFTYHLYNELGEAMFSFSHTSEKQILKTGNQTMTCFFPDWFLNTGRFYLSLYVIRDKKNLHMLERDIVCFDVVEAGKELGEWMGREPGFLRPQFKWTIE